MVSWAVWGSLEPTKAAPFARSSLEGLLPHRFPPLVSATWSIPAQPRRPSFSKPRMDELTLSQRI